MYVLAGQMQFDTLIVPAGEVVWEGHDLQEVLSLLRYVLAGHLQSDSWVAPAHEVEPEGHDKHEVPSLYVLSGHLQSN